MWANSSKRVIVVSRSGHDDVKRFWKRQKQNTWHPLLVPGYRWMVDHFHVTSTWTTTDTKDLTHVCERVWYFGWKSQRELTRDTNKQMRRLRTNHSTLSKTLMPKKERYIYFISYLWSRMKVVHTCDLLMQVKYVVVQIKNETEIALLFFV